MGDTATSAPDLGEQSSKDVIRGALTLGGRPAAAPRQPTAERPLAGLRIIDVGAGNGALVRWLHREGADAFGIEPNAQLLRAAIADTSRPATPGHWIAGSAERLPLRRACADAVLFFNSLHHVRAANQVAALAEAARVLRPGGDLVVVEPLATGSYFELLAPLDDESMVRAAALAALAAGSGRLFEPVARARFTTTLTFVSAEEVAAGFTRADPARAADRARVMPEIRARFEALGAPGPEGRRRFVQPMLVHHDRQI